MRHGPIWLRKNCKKKTLKKSRRAFGPWPDCRTMNMMGSPMIMPKPINVMSSPMIIPTSPLIMGPMPSLMSNGVCVECPSVCGGYAFVGCVQTVLLNVWWHVERSRILCLDTHRYFKIRCKCRGFSLVSVCKPCKHSCAPFKKIVTPTSDMHIITYCVHTVHVNQEGLRTCCKTVTKTLTYTSLCYIAYTCMCA